MHRSFKVLGLRSESSSTPYVAGTLRDKIKGYHSSDSIPPPHKEKRRARSDDEHSQDYSGEDDDSSTSGGRSTTPPNDESQIVVTHTAGSPKYPRRHDSPPMHIGGGEGGLLATASTSSVPSLVRSPLRASRDALKRSISVDSNRPHTTTITREDIYGISISMYRFAGVVSYVNESGPSRLDPDTEIFGLDELRIRLKRWFATTTAPSGIREALTVDEPHMLWHTSPYGSGTRLMTEALCAKNRINLIVASTSAPRNNDSICPQITFIQGQYTRLIRTAVSLAPCVVLIDRLDPHFDVNYDATGHELIGSWDALEKTHKDQGEPVPRVWIVISRAVALSSMLPRCNITPFQRLEAFEIGTNPLRVADCAKILSTGYMRQACRRHIVAYDTNFGAENNVPGVQSEYDALQKRVHPTLHTIAAAMHHAAHPNFAIHGSWLGNVISKAFDQATYRAANTPNATMNDCLPTTRELFFAVQSLPFHFFRSIVFE